MLANAWQHCMSFFLCKNLKLSEEFEVMLSSLTAYSLQNFCGSKWRIWTIMWALRWLLLHVMRTRSQGWIAHFRPLQCQANFPVEIWIAWLPYRTPDKLKGWCFFSWYSIEDPLKIQDSRNAAFEAISFPEPTCLLVSTKTRSSRIINN